MAIWRKARELIYLPARRKSLCYQWFADTMDNSIQPWEKQVLSLWD
jgi:hypothetical protein